MQNRKGEETSPLPDLNRFELTFFDAHQTAAAKFLIDVRHFVRLKLDKRFQATRGARQALFARMTLLRIHIRDAIVRSDHRLPSFAVGRRAAHHANIPPARL